MPDSRPTPGILLGHGVTQEMIQAAIEAMDRVIAANPEVDDRDDFRDFVTGHSLIAALKHDPAREALREAREALYHAGLKINGPVLEDIEKVIQRIDAILGGGDD